MPAITPEKVTIDCSRRELPERAVLTIDAAIDGGVQSALQRILDSKHSYSLDVLFAAIEDILGSLVSKVSPQAGTTSSLCRPCGKA